MKFCVVFCVLLLNGVFGAYPPDFPKCKNADEPCLIKAANDIVAKYPGGLPDVNLLPIDPFHVKTFNVPRNPSSPVSVDIKLQDVTLSGFKGMRFEKFQGLTADMSGRTTLAGVIPSLTIKGKHMLEGNVLILPIKGNGNCEIICKNIKYNYSFDLKKVEKNGKIYAAPEHVKLVLEPEHVQFVFDRIVEGDASLQKSANEFLNSNWMEIFNEIQPGLSKTISLVLKSYITKFFDYEEYNKLYLPLNQLFALVRRKKSAALPLANSTPPDIQFLLQPFINNKLTPQIKTIVNALINTLYTSEQNFTQSTTNIKIKATDNVTISKLAVQTNRMNLIIFCILVVIFPIVLTEFPSNITKCHFADNECFKKTAQEVVDKYYSGIPEINLQEFDPLQADDFTLKTNPASAIKIEISYKNVTFLGMKSMKILSINGSKTNDHFDFDAIIPELIQLADYKINGNILILPIVGSGQSKIVAKNVYFKYSFDMKPIEKNGEIYAKLDHTKLFIEMEHVQFNFENLFNGEKTLGETMNNLMNDNWKDVSDELKIPFSKMFSALVKSRLEAVFSKYPIDEYFLH
ncbi:uncharacterized protein [Musca autumnalis]|uniref:uncharacterized protein n=1 Tax=Musca autumnalis TaxID=221902 RepID=UPI003CEC4073